MTISAKSRPGDARSRKSATEQYCGCKIEHRDFEKDDPEQQHIETVRRQHQIEHFAGKKVHRRPARERDQQTEESADRQKDDGRDRIGLYQLFGCQIDLEPGCGTGAEFCSDAANNPGLGCCYRHGRPLSRYWLLPGSTT